MKVKIEFDAEDVQSLREAALHVINNLMRESVAAGDPYKYLLVIESIDRLLVAFEPGS